MVLCVILVNIAQNGFITFPCSDYILGRLCLPAEGDLQQLAARWTWSLDYALFRAVGKCGYLSLFTLLLFEVVSDYFLSVFVDRVYFCRPIKCVTAHKKLNPGKKPSYGTVRIGKPQQHNHLIRFSGFTSVVASTAPLYVHQRVGVVFAPIVARGTAKKVETISPPSLHSHRVLPRISNNTTVVPFRLLHRQA